MIASKPALPWLLDGHLVETLDPKKVHAFLPADAKIVPSHGVAMQHEDLQWHIQYLETVQRAAMPEFGGYALFGWGHPSLNVPAAYRDLNKK